MPGNDSDSQVAQGGEVDGAVGCSGAASVFVEGDVSSPMAGVFDAPVVANEVCDVRWCGFVGGEAGDEVDGFAASAAVAEDGVAGDASDLVDVRKGYAEVI